jgi:hypothetical protein
MTADELIRQLQKLPPETPVLVEGYETGFDDIESLKSVDVFRFRKAAEGTANIRHPTILQEAGAAPRQRRHFLGGVDT